MSDSDSGDENIEIGKLVDDSINFLNASKFAINPKSFAKLNEKLISNTKSSAYDTILTNKKETLMMKSVTHKDINPVIKAQMSSSLYDPNVMTTNPEIKKVDKLKNLGRGWFDIEPMKLDDKVKRDINMIQMRNYIDPKRFYKNPDKPGSVLHIGTVIEGPSEYKSARLTNKERKQSIVEEILADKSIKEYSKRKYLEIQSEKLNKKKHFKVKKAEKKNKKIKRLF